MHSDYPMKQEYLPMLGKVHSQEPKLSIMTVAMVTKSGTPCKHIFMLQKEQVCFEMFIFMKSTKRLFPEKSLRCWPGSSHDPLTLPTTKWLSCERSAVSGPWICLRTCKWYSRPCCTSRERDWWRCVECCSQERCKVRPSVQAEEDLKRLVLSLQDRATEVVRRRALWSSKILDLGENIKSFVASQDCPWFVRFIKVLTEPKRFKMKISFFTDSCHPGYVQS